MSAPPLLVALLYVTLIHPRCNVADSTDQWLHQEIHLSINRAAIGLCNARYPVGIEFDFMQYSNKHRIYSSFFQISGDK